MCSSVHKLPSHALQFLQSSVLEFFCQWKSRRHVKSFKAHSCLITMAPDHFPNPLLAYWEECWGPCSPMHTVPASSACSSATPDLSSSHTEWMEPPEECGHKRRNGIFAECYHPSTAPCTHATNRYVCPRIYTQTHPTSLGVIGCWGLKKKEKEKNKNILLWKQSGWVCVHHGCKNSQMSDFVGKLGLDLYLTDDWVCSIDEEEELKVAATVFSCFYSDISYLVPLTCIMWR